MTGVWTEVGDRVWVRRYAALDQTIGVIGGHPGLLVIDTRATHQAADELRAELRQLPGDVVGVINTHGHWDHVFGNARFLPAPIHGHVRCAEMVTLTGEEQRRRVMERYPPAVAEQLAEVVLTPPTELFEETAVIALEDRDVELRYLGRGHTDNDIVVRVLDASVLFTGDLLENAPAPAYGDAFPIAWAETGRRLLSLVDGAVVPGHGDPFDVHFAERQVAEIAAVAELARDAVAGSIGLDEAIRRSPFPAEVTGEAIERARLEIGE